MKRRKKKDGQTKEKEAIYADDSSLKCQQPDIETKGQR